MSDAVDQAGMVKIVFVQKTAQIGTDGILILPVLYMFFQVIHHSDYLNIGSAMAGTLQRTQ